MCRKGSPRNRLGHHLRLSRIPRQTNEHLRQSPCLRSGLGGQNRLVQPQDWHHAPGHQALTGGLGHQFKQTTTAIFAPVCARTWTQEPLIKPLFTSHSAGGKTTSRACAVSAAKDAPPEQEIEAARFNGYGLVICSSLRVSKKAGNDVNRGMPNRSRNACAPAPPPAKDAVCDPVAD